MYTIQGKDGELSVPDLQELTQLLESGEVHPDTPVLNNHENKWTTVGALIGRRTIEEPEVITRPTDDEKYKNFRPLHPDGMQGSNFGRRGGKLGNMLIALLVIGGAVLAFNIFGGDSLSSLFGMKGGAEYNQGVEHLRQGQTDQAKEQFRLALEKNPQLGEAHIQMGSIDYQAELFDQAEQSLKQGIQLIETAGKTSLEKITWEEVLAGAYLLLAATEYAQGVEALLQRDEAAVRDTKWSLARQHLEHAAELDPKNKEIKEDLEKMQRDLEAALSAPPQPSAPL